MSRPISGTCKYGHLKSGENLLLRERSKASWTTKDGKKRWHAEYTERVCRICLNRQKREWDAKYARVDVYRSAIRIQELAEHRMPDIDTEVSTATSPDK